MNKDVLDIYQNAISKCPEIERKGKSVPYTSSNGHMFSFINKDGDLGIRFSKERQQEYFNKYNTSYFHSHGAKMNGYIQITNSMLEDQDLIVELLLESYNYVNSLKPK